MSLSNLSCVTKTTIPALIFLICVILIYDAKYTTFMSGISAVKRIPGTNRCPTLASTQEELPLCVENITSKVFKYYAQENFTECDVIRMHSSAVSGRWRQEGCRAKFRMAVLVPLRGRGTHNFTFLMNMHTYFQLHQYDYGIFIIEQTAGSGFNRGMLFNVGFLEVNKQWPNMYDCFVLHDVDVFPMNTTINYQCLPGDTMVHLGNALSGLSFKLPYLNFVGAVNVINKFTYLKMNGFSNDYFGWGAEDDDFYERLHFINGTIKRYPAAETMMYRIPHGGRQKNPKRMALLNRWMERIPYDGVRNMPPYRVRRIQSASCAVRITVEINQIIVERIINKRLKNITRNRH